MYKSILVPVDNSDHSNASIDLGLTFGQSFGSKLVGSHVYAAKLHDVRFKQMEFTLPDEYKEETELEKQREIHDSLITRGLHLISDSYMDEMAVWAEERGLDFERKHFDGKNFIALVDDINDSAYDLVILGALGQGAVRESQVGSVTERVLRRTAADTLVVRKPENADPTQGGDLLVALDGSPQSYGALRTACTLASQYNKKIEIVAVCEDPTERELVESHLGLASRYAGEKFGTEVTTTLLEGKATEALLKLATERQPWLLVVGRIGIDAAEEEIHIGTTAERLVRHGDVNILLSGSAVLPSAPSASLKSALAAAL